MIVSLDRSSGKVFGFKISGTLHDADYEQFVPRIDEGVKAFGKVRLLALFEDFHGWDLHAIWDDTKFATQHCTGLERVALVGDQPWEKWMAAVCRPFTMAKLQYFDASEIEAAWKWLEETP